MRIFVSDRISGVMQSLGMEEGVPIESKLITRQIERAQKEVEGRNFGIRKHLLEYDDVMNSQRQEVYRFRQELLAGEDQQDYIYNLAKDISIEFMDAFVPETADPDDWQLDEFKLNLQRVFGVDLPVGSEELARPELEELILKIIRKAYKQKGEEINQVTKSQDSMRWFERSIMLQIMDQQWKDHLLALDHLREGIGLRGYGQKDPLVEYKRESFELFRDLWNRSTEEIIKMLFLLQPVATEGEAPVQTKTQSAFSYSGPGRDEGIISRRSKIEAQSGKGMSPIGSKAAKVGRNQPCPCGSGKKHKKCCGRAS